MSRGEAYCMGMGMCLAPWHREGVAPLVPSGPCCVCCGMDELLLRMAVYAWNELKLLQQRAKPNYTTHVDLTVDCVSLQ